MISGSRFSTLVLPRRGAVAGVGEITAPVGRELTMGRPGVDPYFSINTGINDPSFSLVKINSSS